MIHNFIHLYTDNTPILCPSSAKMVDQRNITVRIKFGKSNSVSYITK